MSLFRSKYLKLPILLALLQIIAGIGLDRARAQTLGDCPYPPFSALETGRPNVLIILDHSGSMGSGSGSRWVTAQGVVKDIIDEFPNVRFGLMRMDGADISGNDNISIESPHVRQGGKLLKPVGTPGVEIKNYITAWGSDSNKPQTWTTLAETLAAAGQYFATVEVAGSHTGSSDSSMLTDRNADFVNDGIRTNDFIFNTSDGSYGKITSVTASTITATLTGGSDNDWDTDDTYTTTKTTGKGPAGFGAYYKPYHPDHPDSQCHYRTGTLSSGSEPWIDRSETITSQPAGFQNYVAIRTYQDRFSDYANDEADLINLNLPVAATVYVAYQSGKTVPAWLQAYSNTGNNINISDGKSFDLYAKYFNSGLVTLGGNRNGGGDGEFTYFAYVSLPGGVNDCIASNVDDKGRYVNPTSPIQNQCQQSFIIFLTDAPPNHDSDWNIVTQIIGDYDNDGADSDHKYMDDVAKYLYEKDMRSDIEGMQNLVTYVVGFHLDDPLLSAAASKGGGLYFTASSAAALTTALKKAITNILDRISAGGAISTITTSTESSDYLVRAKFLPVSWKGFLETFTLPYVEGEAPLWEAGVVLTQRIDDNTAADREIFTYLHLENPKKQDFESANSSLVEALNGEWSESDDGEVQDMINFIRGDDSNDGAKYRDRKKWFLGDMINSTPRIVTHPKSFLLENDYQTFKVNYLTRTTMIYVGANDGMLHAFRASDGFEAWSFIPEQIRPNLTHLTLDSCHKYYVDLSPTVYDVWHETWVTAGNDWTGWKTVLLGGNRLGGEEYFALDITNPAADAVSILWDKIIFSGRKSSTIPVVGKVKVLAGKQGELDKWLAVITSGYDEDGARTGGIAAVDFPTGTKEIIWREGNSNVDELSTQARAGANLYYSLTSPTGVDSDNDGYLDLIYAGDTEGSLWKFYYDYEDTVWKKVELFDSGGQPITSKPTVAFDDQQNLRIFFGTGKYLVGNDREDSSRNAYYCIVETKFAGAPNDDNHGHYTNAPATPMEPADLADMTLFPTEGNFSSYYSSLTGAEQGAFDLKYAKGWYFQLDDPAGDPAERVLVESTVVAGTSFFTSFIPNEDICGYGGNARLYAVDYKTGFIARAGGGTILSGDDGGEITERQKGLGPGLPSKVVYRRDIGTGLSSVMVQTSDATVHVVEISLGEKLWGIGSWKYVD